MLYIQLTGQMIKDVKVLWNEEAVQIIHRNNSLFEAIDTTFAYFLDNIDRIAADDYIPTEKIYYRLMEIYPFIYLMVVNKYQKEKNGFIVLNQ